MSDDYPRKYWWLVLVAVPLAAAVLAALLPGIFPRDSPYSSTSDPASLDAPTQREPDLSKPQAPDSNGPTEPILRSSPADDRGLSRTRDQPSDSLRSSPTAQTEDGIPPGSHLVRATGIGFAPSNVADEGRKRALARRAAEVDALRHLAEQIQGALVRGISETDMAALSRDEVEVQVRALVKLAKVIHVQANPDGSVEILMEAPLTAERR